MFIVYEKGRKPSRKVYSSGLLWGMGRTKNSALKDANTWLNSYNNKFRDKRSLVNLEDLFVARVFKADKDLFEALKQDGWKASFTVRKGRVITVRSAQS